MRTKKYLSVWVLTILFWLALGFIRPPGQPLSCFTRRLYIQPDPPSGLASILYLILILFLFLLFFFCRQKHKAQTESTFKQLEIIPVLTTPYMSCLSQTTSVVYEYFTCTRQYPPSSLLLEHPGFPSSGLKLPNPRLPTVPERFKKLNLHIRS